MRHILLGTILLLRGNARAYGRRRHRVARHGLVSHVGGRVAEVSGKPAADAIVRRPSPAARMTKLDPNGQYMVEQMYVQYFLPRHAQGKIIRC